MPLMPPTQRAGAWTVGELLCAQARRAPERIALDDGERRLSYRSLNARVNRLAHLLARLRVARGARVAILAKNRSE